MHYANGRPAANGDKVVLLQPVYSGNPAKVVGHRVVTSGVLYDAVAGNDHCNGRIAPVAPSDVYPNLKECLHADDASALFGEDISAAPDTSKGAA